MKLSLIYCTIISSILMGCQSIPNDLTNTNEINKNNVLVKNLKEKENAKEIVKENEIDAVIVYKLNEVDFDFMNQQVNKKELLDFVKNNTCQDSLFYLNSKVDNKLENLNVNYLKYKLLKSSCSKDDFRNEDIDKKAMSYLKSAVKDEYYPAIDDYHYLLGYPPISLNDNYWFDLLSVASEKGSEKATFQLAKYYSYNLEDEYFLLYISKIKDSENNKSEISYLYGNYYYNKYKKSRNLDDANIALSYLKKSHNSGNKGIYKIYKILTVNNNLKIAYDYIKDLKDTNEKLKISKNLELRMLSTPNAISDSDFSLLKEKVLARSKQEDALAISFITKHPDIFKDLDIDDNKEKKESDTEVSVSNPDPDTLF